MLRMCPVFEADCAACLAHVASAAGGPRDAEQLLLRSFEVLSIVDERTSLLKWVCRSEAVPSGRVAACLDLALDRSWKALLRVLMDPAHVLCATTLMVRTCTATNAELEAASRHRALHEN